MNTTHLEEKRKTLVGRREKLIGKFAEAARTRKKRTRQICTEISRANEFLASLDQIVAENSRADGPLHFTVSSLFLHSGTR